MCNYHKLTMQITYFSNIINIYVSCLHNILKKKKKGWAFVVSKLCLLFAFNLQKKKKEEGINCSHMTRRTKFIRGLTVLNDWRG